MQVWPAEGGEGGVEVAAVPLRLESLVEEGESAVHERPRCLLELQRWFGLALEATSPPREIPDPEPLSRASKSNLL